MCSLFNPFPPKSAIWRKMPIHAQYFVNLCEICTTKRPWKDLHTEGIKLNPPSYRRLDLPPLQLLEDFPFVILGSSWYLTTRSAPRAANPFLILDTSQSNLRHPQTLLAWSAAHPRNYLSNGISHGVYQFIVANLEKLGIYLGQERVKRAKKWVTGVNILFSSNVLFKIVCISVNTGNLINPLL